MKFITLEKKELLMEMKKNIFDAASVEVEMISEEAKEILKFDEESISADTFRIVECIIQARINAGVLSAEVYQTQPEYVSNMFALCANNAEKVEIIRKDILGGARIPEENIVEVLIPAAPGLTETFQICIIAINLNPDQIKAIELSAKTAKIGLKVSNFTRKASMIASSSTGTFNRVGREVVLAGTEVGATIAAGTIKTGIEATACALNIGLKDLNPKELMRGDNVQALSKTVRGLFRKDSNSNTVGNGFAAL